MAECPVVNCRKNFKHRMSRDRHLKKEHFEYYQMKAEKNKKPCTPNRDGYSCDVCGKVVKHKNNMYRHFKVCQGNCDNDDSGNTNECLHCGKHFRFPSKLERHLRIHEKELMQWNCDGCGKIYRREDSFKKHLEKCVVNVTEGIKLSRASMAVVSEYSGEVYYNGDVKCEVNAGESSEAESSHVINGKEFKLEGDESSNSEKLNGEIPDILTGDDSFDDTTEDFDLPVNEKLNEYVEIVCPTYYLLFSLSLFLYIIG